MMQKVLEIIFKRVLWPLLRTIGDAVLAQASLWLIDKARELMRKWRREEEAAAASDLDREAIHKKYLRREADITNMEREIPEKMREILRGALSEAAKQTPTLIADSAASPKIRRKSRPRAKLKPSSKAIAKSNSTGRKSSSEKRGK